MRYFSLNLISSKETFDLHFLMRWMCSVYLQGAGVTELVAELEMHVGLGNLGCLSSLEPAWNDGIQNRGMKKT